MVVPAWDQQLPTLIACLDTTLRRMGGAPTYLLTDNPRTVTIDRIAGLAVRHPDVVSAARHYGCGVRTCEPFDPESKGGAEHTVKIAKADLVPTETDLLADYDSFADLQAACEAWCERVNARPHRATGQPPVERLMREGPRLHVLPDNPHLLAVGEERLVGTDQTVSWGNVRYCTPDGHQGPQGVVPGLRRRAGDRRRHRLRARRDRAAGSPRPAIPGLSTSITRTTATAGRCCGCPNRGPAPKPRSTSSCWAREPAGG